MRLFISIELPMSLRKKLHGIGCRLGESVPSVRPVSPEGMHLTLHFLGEVEEARAALFSEMVARTAASHCRFTAAVKGVGTFGRGRAPSVIWAGVEAAAGLLGIHRSLSEGLAGLSMAVEQRDYRPHITIGRVRPGRGVKSLYRLIDDIADEDFGRIEVSSICLMKSTLTGTGAVYESVKTAELG